MSTSLVWRATEWLLAFGPLTRQTALDYFIISPFFDRTSNNAVLRMQMQFSRGGMEGVDEEAELKRLVGSEYSVVHAAPPGLFIIHKRDRSSPTEVQTTAVYYIMNDNVYQSPTLYSVVNERVLTSLHSLSASLSLIRARKPTWTPERLYEWDIKEPAASAIVAATPADDGGSLKRDREDDAEREAGQVNTAAPPADDEDALRPAETFNPLLFRALQSVARALEPPSVAGPAGAAAGAPAASGSGPGTAVGTPAPIVAEDVEVVAPPQKDVNGAKRKGKK